MGTRGWAVVTGASSGLGVDFARQLAARGHDLVLAARRRDRMETLAAELRAKDRIEVHVVECDLGADDGPSRVLSLIEEKQIVPAVLVNNAGFGMQGFAVDLDVPRQLEMIDLNVRALTQLSLAIGAKMAARGSGAIVNLGSVASFQPSPHYAAYAATKAYVLSFSQALAWELAPRGVRVLAHCPGLTKTEFFEAGGIDVSLISVFWMTSERCVALGLRAVDAGRRVIVTGWLNAVGAWLARIVPQGIVMAIAAWLYGPRKRSDRPPAGQSP